jgi:hypothetical protein
MEPTQILTGTGLILAAIIVPGLAVTLAVIPKLDEIKWPERFGLSLIFGLVPQLMIYFLSNNLNVPITTVSSQAAIAGVTVLGLVVWKIRSKA